LRGSIINYPLAVQKAANKLETFKALDGHVSIPEYTESFLEASRWLAEGFTVVSRLKLNGHSGEGILISVGEDEDGLPQAPLYTKYIKKRNEYRLHSTWDEVFFVQKKARKLDVPDEEVNWKVRNLAGGFIYANKEVDVPDEVKEMAKMAIELLVLEFGACDIVEGMDGKWYLLEVNTACGLAGTTLDKYVEMFQRFL
jgi:glutathione synthase/RimK-type ligase-like ATP-grasp enzyme